MGRPPEEAAARIVYLADRLRRVTPDDPAPQATTEQRIAETYELDGLLADHQVELARCVLAQARVIEALKGKHLGDARIANEMVNHFPVDLRCDHDAQMDMVVCDCARVNLGWHPSVRLAKEAWAAHVIDVVKAARGVAAGGETETP